MVAEVTFIDPNMDAEEILNYSKPNTRAIYAETIGNPALNVLDFEKFLKQQRYQIPFIVDNTFSTPYLCQPFKH